MTATRPRRRYHLRAVLMTCTACGYKRIQKLRGTCHKCGEGLMTHSEGKVTVFVDEEEQGASNAPNPE